MSTQIKVTYFGVEGSGRTIKEAKQDAGRVIERLVANHRPEVYQHRSNTLIVYHTATGGEYMMVDAAGEGPRYCCHAMVSFDDARICGLRHMLTNARQVGQYEVPGWVRGIIGRTPTEQMIEDWRSNDGFQLAYRHAQASGIGEGESDWHRWACEHGAEFRPAKDAPEPSHMFRLPALATA